MAFSYYEKIQGNVLIYGWIDGWCNNGWRDDEPIWVSGPFCRSVE